MAVLSSGIPAGSCVWHVVGLQRSIREWAMRQGWGGRPVRAEQAHGILVAGQVCWHVFTDISGADVSPMRGKNASRVPL